MDLTDIKALPILLMMIAVGAIALAIPVHPSSVGIMTPFHQSLQGAYGP